VSHDVTSRRLFLAVAAAGAGLFRFETSIKLAAMLAPRYKEPDFEQLETEPPHYTLRIASSPVEIAAKRIVSPTSYKGQVPAPLLRFKERRRVTIDITTILIRPNSCTGMGRASESCGRFSRANYKRLMSAEYAEDSFTGLPKLVEKIKTFCRKYSSV